MSSPTRWAGVPLADRRAERRRRIGEPRLVAVEQPDPHQHIVDHAEARIEEERPHVAGDDVGQEVGQQDEDGEIIQNMIL